MPKPPATHPIWELLGYTLRFAILAFVLWRNAESFDETEIIVLVTVMFGDGVLSGFRAKALKNASK